MVLVIVRPFCRSEALGNGAFWRSVARMLHTYTAELFGEEFLWKAIGEITSRQRGCPANKEENQLNYFNFKIIQMGMHTMHAQRTLGRGKVCEWHRHASRACRLSHSSMWTTAVPNTPIQLSALRKSLNLINCSKMKLETGAAQTESGGCLKEPSWVA